MILTRIRLHNYRQHADIDQKIEGSIVAVVGRNGSGKSNLLGALQFAFTGEQSGFNKKDLLRWGADEGDVTVEFIHDNVKCVLARSLHTAGATLHYGDKAYKGATAVAEALRTHVGLDKDLCKQAVFVRQAEIDAILFTDPAVRERSFQRLMGIGDASKIHKTMGEVIAAIDMPANYDEQIAEGKARWAEMHTRLQTLQSQLLGLNAARAQAPQVATIKQGISTCHAMLQAVRRFTQARQALTEQQERVSQAEAALAGLDPVDGTGGQATLDQYDGQLQINRDRQRMLTLYDSVFAAWKRAGEAVLALGTQPCAAEQLQTLKLEYDKVTADLNKLLGRHKLHKDMLDALGQVGAQALTECPVCGAAVADENALRRRLTAILAQIQADGATRRAEQARLGGEYNSLNARFAEYQREYALRTAAYDRAQAELNKIPLPTETMADLLAEATALQHAKEVLLQGIMARTSAKARRDTEATRLDRVVADFNAAGTALATLGLRQEEVTAENWESKLEAEVRNLEGQRDTLTQLDTELAGLKATIAELSNQMTALDKTVATLELRRGTQRELRDAVAVLQRTREWFHYANGPHTLSTSVLGVMNQEVNRFLGQFTAPFTVEPSNDMLGFKCLFTDGRPVPPDGPPDASMLSGGQKIQLAVAFRFAAYTVFASKLGLLSLDEPTVYLDDANVGRFCDLLQKVKQVAQGLNLQVWIATHERSVMTFVDTVIDLTPDTHN